MSAAAGRSFWTAPPSRAALSGLLLYLSQPVFHLGFLAWISLIFLVLAVRRSSSAGQAFGLGAIAGLVFFVPGLHWLRYVAFPAWIFAALFESLFPALFAVLVYAGRRLPKPVFQVFWIAGSWTLTEWLRTELPVLGFGWHLLAYSQTFYLWVIQAANTVGAYGLGFVIAAVNALLVLLWELRLSFSAHRRTAVLLASGLLLIAGLLASHGWFYLRTPPADGERLRIALIQSNIPEMIKWRPEAKDRILEIHLKLTKLASFDSPDLAVWPEASFPGYFNRDIEADNVRALAKETGVPVLVGSPHYENGGTYYNSAYLVRGTDAAEERYDKVRLVPFGEYVPFKWLFGWLMPLADAFGVGDFSTGGIYKLFRLYDDVPFGALICFEDIFPELSRRFVESGARFLVVITNDSWFGRTAAPYQHLAASIFRAVENGVPVVRAANTGVSGLISPRGEVTARISAGGEELFVTGQGTGFIALNSEQTNYQRGGYLFPFVLMAVMANLAVLTGILTLKHRRDHAV